MDVDLRMSERHAEDRRQVWALLAMGVPFALAAWLLLAWTLTLFHWFVARLGLGPSFAVAGSAVALAMAIDTWRHPSEYWHRARYFVPGTAPGEPVPVARRGLFAGMPLMAPVNPGNLAEHGRAVSSGCANVVLAGPRKFRQGSNCCAWSAHGRGPCPSSGPS